MEPLTTRLRESLADSFYAGDITSSALVDSRMTNRTAALFLIWHTLKAVEVVSGVCPYVAILLTGV